MSTVIIGGSAHAHQAVNDANADSATYSWSQAQINEMAALFEQFAKDANAKRNAFNQA